MADPVVHYHYHYHYYYATPAVPAEDSQASQASQPPENSVDSQPSPSQSENQTESSSQSSATGTFVPSPGYVRQGIEILDKDRGILSSYGYYNVRDQTQKHRRLVLSEATQYISKDYIQERLYYIASVQPEDEWNPFEEDLEWFEKTFHLSPYRIDPDA